MKRPSKVQNLLEVIRSKVNNGDYYYMAHANQRLQEREVTRQEVKQVLLSGHHEKSKDVYDSAFNNWNYAVKGKTIDKRSLRIIVSFEGSMLIITVIDLSKEH